MKYVEFLSEAKPLLNLFGGKGSNLIDLIRLGINVPPGFIVSTNSYNKFLGDSHLRDQINQILSIEYTQKDVLNISEKIKNLFQKSRIPQEIIYEIKDALYEIWERNPDKISFSVRSSANVEDSKEFSFAGQAESYLNNQTLEEILKSIKNCWISLFSPQALLYILQMQKKKKNEKKILIDLKMAVIVQQMVDSQISGVLFTVNVLNNSLNQMLINSTWGLGQTVTDSSIIPDLIILNKDPFEIIKIIIGKKEKKSVPNPKGSSTILVDNKPELQNKCSLNESELYDLYNLGVKLEEYFNYPQDIEWAIKDNILYTLQSRPITSLKLNK